MSFILFVIYFYNLLLVLVRVLTMQNSQNKYKKNLQLLYGTP
jgi:hypothetical protein